MNEYKVGQHVRYTYSYNSGELKTGNVYTISKISPTYSHNLIVSWSDSSGRGWSLLVPDGKISRHLLDPILEFNNIELL